MPSVNETPLPRSRRIVNPILEFLRTETAGGFVLIAATAIALTWANSPWADTYRSLWNRELGLGGSRFGIQQDLRHWVNDGLMTIFFFVVSLEIKRELVTGELRRARAAAFPVALALGGMVAPALIYLALTAGGPGARGWAIPMATDIAFAVAVLGLAGRRIPSGSRLILLSLAIVDDLGAIVVIALFYSSSLEPGWLLGAVAAVASVLLLRRMGAAGAWFYVLPAVVLWYCAARSGVHPTLAGVVLGLLTPAGDFAGRRPLESLERLIHPAASFVVLPIFALANAGVVLGGGEIRIALDGRVTWAVILGLFAGKPLGILLAGGLALKLRAGTLPAGVHFRDLVPVAVIAGIGFTVSLFVAGLSFDGALLAQAKVGILLGSTASALVGLLLVALRARRIPG